MPKNYERAKRILDQRKEEAEYNARQKRSALEEASPELAAVNRRIAQAGLAAVRASMGGEDSAQVVQRLRAENARNKEDRIRILASLGEPADALEPHYHCSKCKDTGVYEHYYCDCFLDLVKQLSYEELNAGAPAQDCSFGNFLLERYPHEKDPETGEDIYEHMKLIRQYCMDYAGDFGKHSPSLLLYGNTGLGKTHLALSIANTAIDRGYNVLYGSAHNLLAEMEREHFGRKTFENSPEDMILDADLLVLEDLGAEFSSKFTRAAIYNIIDTRIQRGVPTIITTNLMYDQIAQEYDDRVYSRILGNYTPLLFLGRDNRQYN